MIQLDVFVQAIAVAIPAIVGIVFLFVVAFIFVFRS